MQNFFICFISEITKAEWLIFTIPLFIYFLNC